VEWVNRLRNFSHRALPFGGSLLLLIVLMTARVALAASPADETEGCQAVAAPDAKVRADRLYESAQYQRAGECYQAAGDLARANLAFLKAVEPKNGENARALTAQRDTAKALFTNVQQAFRSGH
jgi:hypothetical protein